MFQIKRKIRLSETDATGIIYFTNQLKFAIEAFEAFLEERFGPFHLRFDDYLLPIVDTRSKYYHPLRMGDEIEITLKLVKMGKRSLFPYVIWRIPGHDIYMVVVLRHLLLIIN